MKAHQGPHVFFLFSVFFLLKELFAHQETMHLIINPNAHLLLIPLRPNPHEVMLRVTQANVSAPFWTEIAVSITGFTSPFQETFSFFLPSFPRSLPYVTSLLQFDTLSVACLRPCYLLLACVPRRAQSVVAIITAKRRVTFPNW